MLTRIFLIAAALAFTSPVLAGPSVSGGGKGVVCRETNGATRSVELLDLWEAKIIFGRTIVKSDAPVRDQVYAAIHRMQNYGIISLEDLEFQKGTSELAVKMLEDGAEVFLSKPWPAQTIHRMRGVTLSLSQDSSEDARPSDCTVEQIILYKPDSLTFYINLDLYDLLSKTDQAALILHESLYSMTRLHKMEQPSSVRTRRAVGYVFAGGSFNALPDSKVPRVTCSGKHQQVEFEMFSLFRNEKTGVPQSVVTNGYIDEDTTGFFPRDIKGHAVEARDPSTILSNSLCTDRTEGEFFPVASLRGGGPVDFDRNGALVGRCAKGTFEPFWSPHGTRPVNESNTIKLNCKSTF